MTRNQDQPENNNNDAPPETTRAPETAVATRAEQKTMDEVFDDRIRRDSLTSPSDSKNQFTKAANETKDTANGSQTALDVLTGGPTLPDVDRFRALLDRSRPGATNTGDPLGGIGDNALLLPKDRNRNANKSGLPDLLVDGLDRTTKNQAGKPGEQALRDGAPPVGGKPGDNQTPTANIQPGDVLPPRPRGLEPVQPAPKPGDQPAPKPGDQPAPKPGDQPAPKPGDQPAPKPGDQPAPKPGDQPAPKPGDQPAPKPGDQPAPKPGDQPAPKPGDQPAPKPGDQPAPKPAPKPADVPQNIKTDEKGNVKEVTYPTTNRVRSFERDEKSGEVNGIITKDAQGREISHYVKDNGKWFFQTPEGMRAQIGGEIQVSPKGDVSFQGANKTWRTERPDGTVATERQNEDGSRVAFNKNNQPEKITRKDGSSVEAQYDNGKVIKITENGADGKQLSVWNRNGETFDTGAANGEKRKNVELSANGNYAYESSDGFKYTFTGDNSKVVDDLGLNTKRDAQGRIAEITYPGGKKSRTFGRDEQGNVNSVTTKDEKGERTYVKDGNKWSLDIDGMHIALPGNVSVSAKGDVSFEVKPGVWNTERPNGTRVQEASLDNGARVALNKEGKVDKITRKDGSMIEASYDQSGAMTQITEHASDGANKTTWVKKGDQWESHPAGKEPRKNIELLPTGITTAEGKDGIKQITLGDGRQLKEEPGKARFAFDNKGRFDSITYPDGKSLKFTYDGDSNNIKEVSKSKDGKVVQTDTKVADGKWESKDGAGKSIGGWQGDYKVNANGEVRYTQTDKTKNPEGFWNVVNADGSQHREKVNADGSKIVKNDDKSTVEIDKDGLVRKVSTSKDNYRTFDYDERGQISKVTDFRKGKESGSWDAQSGGGDRINMKLNERGELTYQTKEGNGVIEKADQSKVSIDKNGFITKVTQANGNTRDFTYENVGGRQELTGITDTRKGAKGDTKETWTRKKNEDGALTNSFVSGTGDKVKERKDVEVGSNGDYQYKTNDNKLHIAKAGRDSAEGGMSASVEEARDRLMESLEGKVDEKRMARMKEFFKEYEQRLSDRVEAQVAGGKDQEKAQADAEKTIAGTYDQLSGLVNPTDAEATGQYFTQEQRVKLAENFMFLAQNPLESNQGNQGTCWIHSGWITGGMVQNGDHMARLLKEVALTGKYTSLNNGLYDENGGPKTFSFSKDLFTNPRKEGMNEEAHWTIDMSRSSNKMVPGVPQTYASIRSPVGMIFDQVLPVIGGRPEGRSTGGNFESNPNAWYMDGRKVLDGSQNIMYMVTGKKMNIENEHNPDAKKQRDVLLEQGAVCDSPPGHLRSRHLKKVDGSWYVIQDDQHGNKGDSVMHKITDLKQWLKERPGGEVKIHRDFDKVGDTTIKGKDPGKPEDPKPRPDQPRPRPDQPNPYQPSPYQPQPSPYQPQPQPRYIIHNGVWYQVN